MTSLDNPPSWKTTRVQYVGSVPYYPEMDEIKTKAVQMVCPFHYISGIYQNDAVQNFRAGPLEASGEICEIKIRKMEKIGID